MATPAIEQIKPELEIEEEIELHKKGWVVQRIGWCLIFLLPVLGAFGLFGEGLISSQKASTKAVETSFERFYRYEKEMQVSVSSAGEHIAQMALPQEYLKNFRVVRIIPEPERWLSLGANTVFQFGGNSNRKVTIYMVPQTFGNINGGLSVNNHHFSLHHFIFP